MTDTIPRALVRAQVALEAFRLLPDGSGVVYVLRSVRREDYKSHLWMRPLRGGRPRQLTRGRVPTWAGDLSQWAAVAFLRTPVGKDDAGGEAWVLPLDGGEPWQLTSLTARRRSRPLVARWLAPRARGPRQAITASRQRGAQGPIADRRRITGSTSATMSPATSCAARTCG